MSIRRIMETRAREESRIRIKQPPPQPGVSKALSLREVVETPAAAFAFIEHVGRGFYGASSADRDIARRMLLEQWTRAAPGALIDLELIDGELGALQTSAKPFIPLLRIIAAGLDIMAAGADAETSERIDGLARRLDRFLKP